MFWILVKPVLAQIGLAADKVDTGMTVDRVYSSGVNSALRKEFLYKKTPSRCFSFSNTND